MCAVKLFPIGDPGAPNVELREYFDGICRLCGSDGERWQLWAVDGYEPEQISAGQGYFVREACADCMSTLHYAQPPRAKLTRLPGSAYSNSR